MRKLVKVDHALLGLKVAANGGGFSKQEIDQMVNDRLASGYNEVEIFPVRTQFNEQGTPADYLQLYIFKQYVDDAEVVETPVEAKKKKADA